MSNNGKRVTAKKHTPSEQELYSLISLERGMAYHIRRFARPYQRHFPVEAALKHVREERLILEAAINGDPEAKRARKRKPDGAKQADTVGG